VCQEEYQPDGDKAPEVLRCGHSFCAKCVRNLVRHHPYGRRAAKCPECRDETEEADVRPNHLARQAVLSLLAMRMRLVSLPEGTSLTHQEYYGLVGLLGDHTMKLRSLYRASRDGTTYGDMLRCVGDKTRLVFVIRKDEYVFGAFVSGGLKLPDDPTDWNAYDCDLWHFSLAGLFPQPTKIDIDREKQHVYVAGRQEVYGTKVRIGGYMWLGHSSEELTADMRSCRQNHPGPNVLAGSGHACLGVSVEFMADDLEVLHVVDGQ